MTGLLFPVSVNAVGLTLMITVSFLSAHTPETTMTTVSYVVSMACVLILMVTVVWEWSR
jgi:hypothetical protein